MVITQKNHNNGYLHPNIVINLEDQTIIKDDSKKNPELPDFNMLIPICVPRGITNTLEIFYPGEPGRFIITHGEPNAVKNGFGPNMIHDVLNSGAKIGVYTINLRGKDATKANIIVSLKYKVEKDVPYTDEEGNQYYIEVDEFNNKKITTDPGIDNEEVKRDVLHIKFVPSYVENCHEWTDIHTAMNDASNVEDENGYFTLPWFGVMYRGSTSYGNTIYWSMTPRVSEADNNTYFGFNMFDGENMIRTNQLISMDPSAGNKYGADYYVEPIFNANFNTMRFMSSEVSDDVINVIKQYLYTVGDVVNGTEPSIKFSSINPFDVNTFGIVMDAGTIDIKETKAFMLAGGTDGEIDRDKLFEEFFKCEIVNDLKSPLRYRFSYIPDCLYNPATKRAIAELVEARVRMTNTTLMVGSFNTFESAATERRAEFYKDNPNLRLIAKCQSPMRHDKFTRKTFRFPASYYDTIALAEHIRETGNPYTPFAGYRARWTDYVEDTMVYPSEDLESINEFSKARVNLVMKDSADGGYLSEQNMDINFESDQLEFSNSCLVADMIYDTVKMIHQNHFNLNEAEDVQALKENIDEFINGKYRIYAASLQIKVYREGTTGRSKNTNIVEIIVNLKDISKYAKVNLKLIE